MVRCMPDRRARTRSSDEADVEQRQGADDGVVAEAELYARRTLVTIPSRPIVLAKKTRVARAMTISGTMMLM